MKIYLYRSISGPPTWWRNFTNEHSEMRNPFTTAELNQLLEPYDCRYVQVEGWLDDDDYIEFASEQGYTFFRMTWS